MTILISEDEDETGGFAFIDLGARAPSPLLSFRRQDTEPRHLGSEGWQPEVAWLAPLSATERQGRTVVRFGPNVVDHIEELVPIEIVAQDGTSFGVVSWPFITPAPAGRGLLAADPMPPPSLTASGPPPSVAVAPTSEPVAPEPLPESEPEPEPAPASTFRASAPVATTLAPPRRPVWPALFIVALLVAAAAVGAYLNRDALQGLFAGSEAPRPVAQEAAPVVQEAPPAAPTPPEPPRFSGAELRQRHARLIAERAEPAAFVSLGETALASQQGGPAFHAFEEADPVTNPDAAWQLARFYDPRNSDAAYRDAAQPNAARAAYYYALWRNRSPRHTDALRSLCEAQGGPSARDDRLRAVCR